LVQKAKHFRSSSSFQADDAAISRHHFGHRKEHSDGCIKRAKRDDGIMRESRIDLQECSDGKPFDKTFDETFDEPSDEHSDEPFHEPFDVRRTNPKRIPSR